MIDRAHAGRGKLERLLGCAHVGDQIADVAIGHAGMHQQQRRRRADQPDRREVLAHVVADVGEHVRAGRQRRGVAEQQRVAVGRALGDGAGGDRAAAAAGAVLHHHLLAERGAELVGDGARHDVDGAAGRQRDHQRDRPVGVVLLGGGGKRYRQARRQARTQPSFRCTMAPLPSRPWRYCRAFRVIDKRLISVEGMRHLVSRTRCSALAVHR